MLSNDERFSASRILDELRRAIGDSEFGYRAQGLLAHALMHLSWTITAVKPQGHPDIVADGRNQRLLLQVKSVHARMRRQHFCLEEADLEGIRPSDQNSAGYFAILDCTIPLAWLLVDYNIMKRHVTRRTHMVSLHAMRNKEFSSECTDEFVRLVLNNQNHVRGLDFHILTARALRGEPLL